MPDLYLHRLLDAENVLTPRARTGMPYTRPVSVAQPLPARSYSALRYLQGVPSARALQDFNKRQALFLGDSRPTGGLNTNVWTPYHGVRPSLIETRPS